MGKGESAGSDVTKSPEGRRSRSNGAITDSSKQDTMLLYRPEKTAKRGETILDELLSPDGGIG